MAAHRIRRLPHILVVEDSIDDRDLILEAFKEAGGHAKLTVVEDGDQALAMLRREGRYASLPRPDLIVLDLNLPRRSGHEVLADLKADTELKRIPVIVLSTSSARGDVLASYELAANCHLTKPSDLDDFLQLVQRIDEFWLGTATLPT
jgi:two-component system, chemotaxis family, response regulator Rcp1